MVAEAEEKVKAEEARSEKDPNKYNAQARHYVIQAQKAIRVLMLKFQEVVETFHNANDAAARAKEGVDREMCAAI